MSREILRSYTAAVRRRLPKFRGHGRLANVANRLFLSLGCNPLAQVKMQTGHTMKVDLRTWSQHYAYYSGIYDQELIDAALRLTATQSVVLDVGANVGFYTLPLALQQASVGGRVYAFEPVPANFKRLVENIRLNQLDHRTVAAIPYGLSASTENAYITLREDFVMGGHTGNATVVIDDGLDDKFCKTQINLQPLDGFARRERMTEIDFIKVDIEGHEDLFSGRR